MAQTWQDPRKQPRINPAIFGRPMIRPFCPTLRISPNLGPAFRPACPRMPTLPPFAIRRCFSLQYRKASPCSLDREDFFQHLGIVRKFAQLKGSALPAISKIADALQGEFGGLIRGGVLPSGRTGSVHISIAAHFEIGPDEGGRRPTASALSPTTPAAPGHAKPPLWPCRHMHGCLREERTAAVENPRQVAGLGKFPVNFPVLREFEGERMRWYEVPAPRASVRDALR